MKKFLLILFTLAGMLIAATGDITNAYVNSNGFSININIQGMDSSGVYKFNWGKHAIQWGTSDTVYHVPTDSTPYLLVKRFGYDSTTAARTFCTTKVYIDTVMRRNYPNNLYDSAVQYLTDSVVITCALSEYITIADTIKYIYFPKNIYRVSTDTNLAYVSESCTNNSTVTYSNMPVKFKWSKPPRDVVNSDFTVRWLTTHRSGTRGRFMAACIVSATDNHSHTYLDTIRQQSIESTEFTDSIKVEEWIDTVSVSGFTKGDSITVNVKCLPFWGDSLWTGDGVYTTKPTPMYGPFYCYFGHQYVARVNASTGNNGTGAIVWDTLYNPDSPPEKFQTIAGAINKIRSTKGTADILGGILYLEAGDYTLYGGTVTTGTFSSFNLTISNFRSEVVNITGLSGSSSMPVNSYMKCHGLNFTMSTGNMLASENAWWADSSFDVGTGGVWLYSSPCNYATRCKFNQDLDLPFTTSNYTLAIGRGLEFTATGTVLVPYCAIGFTNTVNYIFKMEYTSMTCPKPLGSIMAYCYIKTSGAPFSSNADSSTTNGVSFIGNIIESTSDLQPILDVATGGGSLTADAYEFYNNTFLGSRCNMAYNSPTVTDSTNTRWRRYWAFRNNIIHYRSIVTDDDSHIGDPGNKRQGNWSLIWGVGSYGNIIVSEVQTYTMAFPGIRSMNPNRTWINDGSINTWIKFVDDNSWTGCATGNGDYHIAENSPAILLTADQILSKDIEGNNRADTGAIGVYGFNEDHVTIDSIRPNPQYPSDSCTIWLSGAGSSGVVKDLTADSIITPKYYSDTQIDFYTWGWSRGWHGVEVTNNLGFKDTTYLRIVIPRKTN